MKKIATIFCVLVFLISVPFASMGMENTIAHKQQNGWLFPYLGAGKGTWDTSVGLFFWKHEFHARNLQLRADMDLAPGLRWHTIVRSNDEMDTLSGFHPQFDENYLEGYGFDKQAHGTFSASLRVGTIRYLHFPYPDDIAMFDQVPGIGDLEGGVKTGYSGELLTLDYANNSGLGVHASGIHWGFGQSGSNGLLEGYVSYHKNFGKLHFETHVGQLAVRTEPLGSRAGGYDVYAGIPIGGYTAGLLYEKLHDQPVYTGVMVTFPMDRVTKAMGQVAFDYDRDPQGFAMQVPLVSGRLGGIRTKAPANGILVGEIVAERVRTYWQNGQVRNFYEHRLSAWGENGEDKDLIVVMKAEPWRLQAEALVSPHTFGAGLKTWEHDRQGPAQISQKVVYQFYRIKS
jgi:hypothetical protein